MTIPKKISSMITYYASDSNRISDIRVLELKRPLVPESEIQTETLARAAKLARRAARS